MILNIYFILVFYVFFTVVSVTRLLFQFLGLLGIQFPQLFARKKSVLFIENLPVENAGYHYRAGIWADMLREKNYIAKVKTLYENKDDFEDNHETRWRYLNFLLYAIVRKYYIVLSSVRYERVVVRRELLYYNDYGDLFMAKLMVTIHPDTILDFDDDIGAAKKEPRSITNMFGKILMEHPSKFYGSLGIYRKFIVGSQYLKELVLEHNKKITSSDICVIPTCVDYDRYEAKKYLKKDIITFGWIGGINNLFLLELLYPALEKLSKQYPIKLLIISGQDVNPAVSFPIENRKWSLATEIEDMYLMDIGLMPLPDNRISRGKCGFKLLQYMGLGIVSVASGITINKEIVDHGINSYLVEPNGDWEAVLKHVIEKDDFGQIGKNAKAKVHNCYTFTANLNKYTNFIDSLCAE